MMMMQVLEGEEGELSSFHSGEANIHYTTDKSFALNMGWDLNWITLLELHLFGEEDIVASSLEFHQSNTIHHI